MSTITTDIVQVRFANRPGTESRRPLAAGPASTLSEVDRRRVFFTRGPPGVVKDTIEAAFLPYGEAGLSSLRALISCSIGPAADLQNPSASDRCDLSQSHEQPDSDYTRGLPRLLSVRMQIEETNLFPDKATGSAKGCGFVTFRSQEQAQNAMNALSGALMLQVRPALPCARPSVEASGCLIAEAACEPRHPAPQPAGPRGAMHSVLVCGAPGCAAAADGELGGPGAAGAAKAQVRRRARARAPGAQQPPACILLPHRQALHVRVEPCSLCSTVSPGLHEPLHNMFTQLYQ